MAAPLAVTAQTADRIAQLEAELIRNEAELARLIGYDPNHPWIPALQATVTEQQARLAQYRAGSPNLQLLSPFNVTTEPGATQEITITLRNVGTRELRSLNTLAVPSANAPFTVEFLQNSNRVGQIAANSQRNMTLSITVNENAAPGSHHIDLNHFFENHLGAPVTATDRINIQIAGEEDKTIPTLELTVVTSPTTPVYIGQTATFFVDITNTSEVEARNIEVRGTHGAGNVIAETSRNPEIIRTLAAGETRRLNFNFTPTAMPTTSTVVMRFGATFDDGTAPDDIAIFTVATEEDDDDEYTPSLEIHNFTVPTSRVNVGQTATVSFDVHNVGYQTVPFVFIDFAPSAAAIVPTTIDRVTVPSLAPGESRRVSFSFSPSDAARTSSYDIEVNISHSTLLGGATTRLLSHTAAFIVYNPAEEDEDTTGRPTPRVMVTEHTLNPPHPRAGEEFELTITIRNASNTETVNNVGITLAEEQRVGSGMPGQTMAFAGFQIAGSDFLHVDTLRPQQEVTKVLHVTASMEATPGVHIMGVNFSFYTPGRATALTSNQRISIPVSQQSRLEFAHVSVPEWGINVGSPVWFSFTVINSGRTNLINLRMRVEGNFDVSDAGGEDGEHLGMINQQRSHANVSGRITPLEGGPQSGYIIVTAEDPAGDIVEARHRFSFDAQGGWGGDDPGMWGDDYRNGGMMIPGRPGPGIEMPCCCNNWGMGWGDEEEDEPGFLTRIFTREVEEYVQPEWWDEEWQGEFTPEAARNFGITPETVRRVNWLTAIGIPVVLLAVVVGIPVLIIISRKRKRVFDEDED